MGGNIYVFLMTNLYFDTLWDVWYDAGDETHDEEYRMLANKKIFLNEKLVADIQYICWIDHERRLNTADFSEYVLYASFSWA